MNLFNLSKLLDKEITAKFKKAPIVDSVKCDLLGVDTVTLRYENDNNPKTKEIGVMLSDALDHSGFMIEVYVVDNYGYDFFPLQRLNKKASDERVETVVKTVLRLMRDEDFFDSLKK